MNLPWIDRRGMERPSRTLLPVTPGLHHCSGLHAKCGAGGGEVTMLHWPLELGLSRNPLFDLLSPGKPGGCSCHALPSANKDMR